KRNRASLPAAHTNPTRQRGMKVFLADASGWCARPEPTRKLNPSRVSHRGLLMSASNGWWNDLFQGLALDFWEQAVPEQTTQTEADFLFGALNVSAGAKVLDVPCGNGRLSLALAGRGLRMTGIDLAGEY